MAARATAVIIDGLLTFVGLGTVIAVLAGQTHTGNGGVGFNLHGGPAFIWLILSLGYWIVCERAWGATLGKRLFSITVVTRDGGRPSWLQATIRNLLRFVDGIPYVLPYLVGFVIAKTDDDRRRLGDRAAGTRVTTRTPPAAPA
jgi:uncharacterized RDD family membrane protein YckC